MSFSAILGFISGAIHLSSYGLFAWLMVRGGNRPNAATWILWTFLAGLNASSYMIMSGDLAKAATPIAGFVSCLFVLSLSIFKGKLCQLKTFDWICLVIGIAAGVWWWVSRNAACANLLLQAAFVLSNFPTFRDVWKNPFAENPAPWLGWGLAYVLSTIVVILRWQNAWIELAYPVAALLTDGGVGFVVLLRRRMRWRNKD